MFTRGYGVGGQKKTISGQQKIIGAPQVSARVFASALWPQTKRNERNDLVGQWGYGDRRVMIHLGHIMGNHILIYSSGDITNANCYRTWR